MMKATSVPCLCSGCEGMNALRRRVGGTCIAIDIIAGLVSTTKDTNNEHISLDLVQLIVIKETIAKLSKYDTIVACLQPSLVTKKPEDANMLAFMDKIVMSADSVGCGPSVYKNP